MMSELKQLTEDAIQSALASSLLSEEEFFRFTLLRTASRFKCEQCGKCCGLDVMIYTDDIKRISNHLGITKKEFKNKYISVRTNEEPKVIFKHRKPCVFQDEVTKKCKIYDEKPAICTSYPFNAIEVQENGILNTIQLPEGCIGITKVVEYFNSVTMKAFQLKAEGFYQVLDHIHADPDMKRGLTKKIRENMDSFIEDAKKYVVFKNIISTQQVKTGKNRPKHLNTFE